MKKLFLLQLLLTLTAFIFTSCESETVDAIDLTFKPTIQKKSTGVETKSFYYANQPYQGRISLEVDPRNESTIETSFITEAKGYMVIEEENGKKTILPGESFVYDYRKSSLPFEIFLSSIGKNAVTFEFNSESYSESVTDTILIKDLFYDITVDSIPDRILVGKKFSFLLHIEPKEESDIKETAASAVINKGAGTVYVQNDVVLVNKPSEEFMFITPENVISKTAAAGSPDTKAPVTATLNIGKNTLTYLPQDDEQNEILLKINNPYNSAQEYTVAFDVQKPVFKTEALTGEESTPYVSKDYSFLLKVSQVDVYEGNSYTLSYRHLTPTSSPILKVNAQELEPGASLAIKEGENIMVLNSPTKENYQMEFIVTDQFGSQYKDTANISFQDVPMYNITVPEITGGTVIGAGTYEQSTQATLTAEPATGNSFAGWYDEKGELLSSNLAYSLTVTENKTITAKFAKQIYKIDVTAGEGGTATGSGNFEFGSSVTVRATPNNGYSFAGWLEFGNSVSIAPSYMFEATCARTLVASFEKNQIAATIDKPTQDVKVGQEAPIQLSIAEDNYEGLFSVQYELVGGAGTFSGGEKQTVGAGTHTMSFIPSTAGTHTYRLTITDRYDISKTVNVTVTATLSPIVLQPNLTTFNLNINQEAEIQLNVSEIAYNDKFTLRYDLSGAKGELRVNDALLGSGLNTSINSGKTTLKFKITQIGDATLKLSVSDTRGQTETVEIGVHASSVITVTAGVGGAASGGGTFDTLNSTASLVATPETGYSFIGWYESGAKVSGDATYSFPVTTSRTIEARFQINSYQINASANPTTGGTVIGAGKYNHGTQQTVIATPATGHDFTGWYESGAEISRDASYNFTVIAARMLEARFAKQIYKIDVTAGEGGTVTGTGNFEFGTNVTVRATPNNGYSFAGWQEFGNNVSNTATYMFEATKARTLVATFKKNEITASVDKPSQDMKVGQEAPIQLSIAEDNYEGLFSVKYELVSGTGTFSGGTTQTVGAGRHAMNFVPSTAGTHTYRLVITDQYGTSKTVNVTVTATLAPIVLQPNLTTFNLSLNQEAEIQLNVSEIAYSDKFTLRYDLSGANGEFKVNNVVLGSGLNTTINNGKTTLKFQINQVGDANLKLSISDTRGQTEVLMITVNASSTISVTAGNGGTATGGGTFNTLDATANLVATPNTGYLFDGWYENGNKVSSNVTYSFPVTVSRAIEAKFLPDSYQINTSANPASGGTVSGAGSYNYNTQQAVTASPNSGYSFAGWYEGSTLVSSSTVYPFTVTNARTLEARFSINSYQLNVVASPAAGGSVSGSGTFQYGTQHTITATPNTAGRYTFTGWNDGNTNPSRVVTIGASDVTYTAIFEPLPPADQPVFCDINGSGTVKINGNPLVSGTPYPPGTYTLTAHPSSGWSSSWTSKPIVITDHEIRESVTFTQQKATISLSGRKEGNSSGGRITTTGGGLIEIGRSCTISTSCTNGGTGQASRGAFLGWYQDGEKVSSSKSYTFTVRGDASFVAYWTWD